ncbi:MAG: M14 family metallopeptidase [Anaerolineales bacterium]
MKNTRLFLVGAILGGTILFSILNLQKFIAFAHADQNVATPTQAVVFPYLIATEPVQVRQTATQEIPTSTVTSQPRIVFSPTSTPSPTATPLVLLRDQKPEVIGTSVNGLPLKVYSFGTGEHGRMIVAGIHGGDEWNTVTLANQLIEYVNQNPQVISEDVTLYILQNLNPDGETRSHDKYGRLNSNGVDLNRNFPFNWQQDWDRAGCWNYLPTTSGSYAGSEPETQAVVSFLSNHSIEALISYHSAALGIFPGGEPWDERSIQFAEAIDKVSSYPFPPLDTGCVYTGTLADYAVSVGIAAVDLELTNHIETDFDMNLKILETLLTFQPE